MGLPRLVKVIGVLACTPVTVSFLSSQEWPPAVRAERDMELVLIALRSVRVGTGDAGSNKEEANH